MLICIGPNSLYCVSCGKESRMMINAVFNHLCSACHLTVFFFFLLKQYQAFFFFAERGIFITQYVVF